MHTDHSGDCATPVEVLLQTARDRGLGAIAITDHNEVSGALEAAAIAAGMDGLKVIVAEEVKTAEQGEVIGLFLKEKIPKGLTMAETIAAIRDQGGLVYVPHPFDRFHSVPDYEHLIDIVEEIDILEVFNPRVAVTAFNEEAERFARKYRIVAGAGSDSHVAQGLGSVRTRIHDFDGPAEFLEAMRDADITRKHKNLLYVQTLKLLQTAGRPKAPKRQVSDAKPVRGGRPRRTVAARGSAEQELMQAERGKGAAPASSKKVGQMRGTDDEIREKYLERAIRELNQMSREIQECPHCPRGKLMPVLGSGHPQADVIMLKHAPMTSEIEEGVAFYGRSGNALMKSFKRLGIDPLVVYGTLCVKCPIAEPDLAAGECVARLVEEIAIVQPKILVVMGEPGPAHPQRPPGPPLPPGRAARGRHPGLHPHHRRPLRPRHRRLARRGGRQATLLARLPHPRHLVRGPPALLTPTAVWGLARLPDRGRHFIRYPVDNDDRARGATGKEEE